MLKIEDLKPIAYELAKGRDDYEKRIRIDPITLRLRYQEDGTEKWVIYRMETFVLNTKGKWELEPPFSRTAPFLKRTRFNTIEDALKVWEKIRDHYE